MFGALIAVVLTTLVAQDADRLDDAPLVRTELGMSEAQFLERSTYPFDPERASRIYDTTSYGFSGPFDFVFTLDGRALRFEDIGPLNISHRVVFDDDQLQSIALYPHREGQTVDQVLAFAQAMEDWFSQAGFTQADRLRILRNLDYRTRPDVRPGDDLRALLQDPEILVAEMVVYSATRNDLSVSVTATNSQRFRYTARPGNEPYVLDEADRTYWLISMTISDRHGRSIANQ